MNDVRVKEKWRRRGGREGSEGNEVRRKEGEGRGGEKS